MVVIEFYIRISEWSCSTLPLCWLQSVLIEVVLSARWDTFAAAWICLSLFSHTHLSWIFFSKMKNLLEGHFPWTLWNFSMTALDLSPCARASRRQPPDPWILTPCRQSAVLLWKWPQVAALSKLRICFLKKNSAISLCNLLVGYSRFLMS